MQGFFVPRSGTDAYDPLPEAVSGWDDDLVRGPAVAALLVRAAEALPSAASVRLARVAFEFFRPTRMRTSRTEAVSIRRGRRLTLIDSHLLQGDQVTARAHLLYVATGPDAPGQLWSGDEVHPVPDDSAAADEEERLYRCGDQPWTPDIAAFRNGLRKQVWQRPIPIVVDEQPSAYQVLAAAADLTNLVVHAGSRGVEHINADLCFAVNRPPAQGGVGIAASHQTDDAGISTGSAVIFDANGTFGVTMATGLSNVEQTVSLTSGSTPLSSHTHADG